jgi:hypothetical protein
MTMVTGDRKMVKTIYLGLLLPLLAAPARPASRDFVNIERLSDRVLPSHSLPLVKSDLAPVRDYYRRMLAGVRSAQREGLTLEEAKAQLAVRTNFPALREAPPGAWSHGMHDRNLRNLWRIVQAERQPANPKAAGN